ncbi:MAG: winged helix DNA-binding protein [Pigmentiphaga sp.]|uniref:MarR family winged helix-turn-helix transcriptional regulator n=1 Tax=Pigmentiphaga sp. TaxID=1977564 RepID=UPI0029AE62DD|nr:MarR family transcriptional regulator [Pigmentiphaga sp.]MDX3905328.1 winged helix DNA-binding protein [Pigmentiphaga sp.]
MPDYSWRQANAGRILSNALRRFEDRVLELLAQAGYPETRLTHVNLTRHLDLEGTRMSELARRASMTNAAMTELIDQCVQLGLVQRQADPADRRARVVSFTDHGRAWLDAFGVAVRQAEEELVAILGPTHATPLLEGLGRYGAPVESIAA